MCMPMYSHVHTGTHTQRKRTNNEQRHHYHRKCLQKYISTSYFPSTSPSPNTFIKHTEKDDLAKITNSQYLWVWDEKQIQGNINLILLQILIGIYA